MKCKFVLAAITATMIACGTTQAATVTLQSLLNGGTLTSGDKKFDNFAYSPTGQMPSAADINVTNIVGQFGNFGIQFSGGFFDAIGGGASDALITFDVQVTNPNFKISGANLFGNPSVVNGSGMAAVTETFLPQEPAEQLMIFDLDPGVFLGAASTNFANQYTKISVQKDILLDSGTGLAQLSFVSQTFNQEMVPEPASVGLIGMGLFGLMMTRRRRS